MFQDEFKSQIEANYPTKDKVVTINDAGRIELKTISRIESKEYKIRVGDEDKIIKRLIIIRVVEGKEERISCPLSVADQLNEIMDNSHLVAFKVIKNGTGLLTKYQVIPEVMMQ